MPTSSLEGSRGDSGDGWCPADLQDARQTLTGHFSSRAGGFGRNLRSWHMDSHGITGFLVLGWLGGPGTCVQPRASQHCCY